MAWEDINGYRYPDYLTSMPKFGLRTETHTDRQTDKVRHRVATQLKITTIFYLSLKNSFMEIVT